MFQIFLKKRKAKMSSPNYICPNCQFTGVACGAVIFEHQRRIEIQCANCHKKIQYRLYAEVVKEKE